MRVDMSQLQTTAPRRTSGLLARVLADKRRHKRLALSIPGRFMRQDKQEYACELVDLSAGGGAVTSAARPEPGERIVASFEHIGMLEGTIVRTTDNGFAFRIMATKHKREKLIAQLMWLANRNELDSAEERRHERITPPNSLAMIQFGDNAPLTCRLLDISISGASIASTLRPPMGTDVTLGRLRARVVRHHAHGFGVEFMDLQNAAALRRHFG
jgi:c-di-GMP-binding flagellar brake protein YcgR